MLSESGQFFIVVTLTSGPDPEHFKLNGFHCRFRRFAALDPTLFPSEQVKLSPNRGSREGQFRISAAKSDGFEMVPRGFEPLLPT